MRDLRLIGVHEDGQHLLMSDTEGERYRLLLDEPLRAAARRDRPRLGQLQIEIAGGMRPREVQALIRGGLSAEEVADRSGWTVEKVRRFEGPVLAEREHVAGLAQGVRMRSRAGGGSGGGGSATLATRVNQRLEERGVDPAVALWDSARNEDGEWTVLLRFPAGGRERQARWGFDVPAQTLTAANDEARWLSGDDPAESDSTIPPPHLVSAPMRASKVYDVEAEGGLQENHRRPAQEPVDLMSAMRERASHRGRRRKSRATQTPVDDAPREDALPLEEIAYDPESMPPPPSARGTHPDDEPSEGAELSEAPEVDEPVVAEVDEPEPEPVVAEVDETEPEPVVAEVDETEPEAVVAEVDETEPEAVVAEVDETEPEPVVAEVEAEPDVADDGEDVLDASQDLSALPDKETDPETDTDTETGVDEIVLDDVDKDDDAAVDDVAAASGDDVQDDAAADSDEDPAMAEVPEPVVAEAPVTVPDDHQGEDVLPAKPAPKPAPPPSAPRRNGRRSVPSWDDVMFGKRPD